MSGANVLAPETAITLDRERKLIFDFNAIAAIERATGRNMLDRNSWNSFTASDIRAFIWAGLLREDPKVTIELVGNLITLKNARYVSERLSEAIKISMPEAKPEEATEEASPLATAQVN